MIRHVLGYGAGGVLGGTEPDDASVVVVPRPVDVDDPADDGGVLEHSGTVEPRDFPASDVDGEVGSVDDG